MRSRTQYPGVRTGNGRALAAIAMAGVAAVVLAGCTSSDRPVEHPSRILQTVDTRLAADGSITAISDTAIAVGQHDSSSSVTQHDAAEAARDLPLRVTTQYTTSKKSGTDLADLAGYSGRVDLDPAGVRRRSSGRRSASRRRRCSPARPRATS
jgi:hypothetical protein